MTHSHPQTYRAPADKLRYEYSHATKREIHSGKKREWFVADSAWVPYQNRRPEVRQTPAVAAWCEAGQVTLYRNGRVVA